MVNSCAAFGCSNRYSKESNLSFHKFPFHDKELCKKWIIALKRDNFTPSKYSVICSNHFIPDDYNNPDDKVSLKLNAVPSVFIFSQKLKRKRKPPSIRHLPAKINKHCSTTSSSTITTSSTKTSSIAIADNDAIIDTTTATVPPDNDPILNETLLEAYDPAININNNLKNSISSSLSKSSYPTEKNNSIVKEKDYISVINADVPKVDRKNNNFNNAEASVTDISANRNPSDKLPINQNNPNNTSTSLPDDPNNLAVNCENNAVPATVSFSSTSIKRHSQTEQKLRRKIKTLQQKLRRKDRKIKSLKSLLEDAENENMISKDAVTTLKENFSGLSLDIIKNQLSNQNKKAKGHRYSDEIKKFALTLHFYSARAYNFLRPMLSLPAPSSILNWTSSVKCEPGFFQDVFNFLNTRSKSDDSYKYCCLIIDAMAIKSSIIFDKSMGHYTGFADFGVDNVACEPDVPATEALVFMLSGLKGHWKTPIGYVLCNKIKACDLTSLILKALEISSSYNIDIRCITFDGAIINFNSVATLGANFGKDLKSIKPNFPFDEKVIHIIPDACHMLKLSRNALNNLEVFVDGEGNYIKWSYIHALHAIQEEEGLKFANKISARHIQFHRHKMNVKIAAQTFSSSVADAIDFLRIAGHPSFKNSQATVKFIRTIDRLFDILNSRNPYAKNFKKPLTLREYSYWGKILDDIILYLSNLTDNDRTPLLKNRRKTFVLGLIADAISVKNLALELLNLQDNSFKYILTYKMSQDHLELLFACIRGKNGFNNNPNVVQFKSSLKRILLRNSIVASKYGNCQILDNSLNGSIFSLQWNRNKSPVTESNNDECDKLENIDFSFMDKSMSTYKEAILGYISGYIVRKLLQKTSCADCSASLLNAYCYQDHNYAISFRSFINLKNRGGLVNPSDSVFNVIKICENVFKWNVCIEEGDISTKKYLKSKLICQVNKIASTKNIFGQLNKHDVETSDISGDMHSTQLIKMISNIFFNMRFFRYAQHYTENVLKKSNIGLRQQSNKLILFKGL